MKQRDNPRLDSDKRICGFGVDSQYVELAVEVLSMLADATRVRLILALRAGEMSVSNLADIVGKSPAAVSQLFAKLRLARIVIVVGSGPAGYTAAIYLARADLSLIVLTSSVEAGGALVNTTEVENFPGFPDGIMGPDLMDNMRRQAERPGARLVYDDATTLEPTGDVKTITTGSGDVYGAHTVVLAMGSAYRKLGVEGEQRLTGRGVSW